MAVNARIGCYIIENDICPVLSEELFAGKKGLN